MPHCKRKKLTENQRIAQKKKYRIFSKTLLCENASLGLEIVFSPILISLEDNTFIEIYTIENYLVCSFYSLWEHIVRKHPYRTRRSENGKGTVYEFNYSVIIFQESYSRINKR